MGEGDIHPLVEALQIGSATLEISVENSYKAKNKSTIGSSYTVPQNVPKGRDILFHRQRDCCMHNI